MIGTGDWNDGMNRVGERGEGESVWLGWFLYAALTPSRRSPMRAATRRAPPAWRAHADALQAALEREAWDGDWYRRGFFDDGTPLGSATSDECRIDSIAQSWAVLSGAADAGAGARAMAAVERESDPPAGRAGAAVHAAIRQDAARSRLHQGLSARHSRERRPVHPCRAVVGDGLRRRSARATRRPTLFSLLNPINHARTRADVHRYKVEPYVVAADVYAMPPHVGRGGWTWYTGSAGWMQRAGIESILGCVGRGIGSASIPASRKPGRASRSRSALVRRDMRSGSTIPDRRGARRRFRRPRWREGQ